MAVWIAGITRGHNGAVCLLKDGEIVFAIEEERLSRVKYDGTPYLAMLLIQKYTSKLDYLVVTGSHPLKASNSQFDWTGEDLYTGFARKIGLIDKPANATVATHTRPNVIDVGHLHHSMHAACAFYKSGFDNAVALIIDGAGTQFKITSDKIDERNVWEVESIIACSYPNNFEVLYKHMAGSGAFPNATKNNDNKLEIISSSAGIVKTYEAVTEFCGWIGIEAGKTMGLFPYGNPNSKIPPLFVEDINGFQFGNKSMFVANYPQTAYLDNETGIKSRTYFVNDNTDVTLLQDRRDMAYAVQTQSQDAVLRLIIRASEMAGTKNVVLSGGYALNCVANYHYLTKLNELGINLYVEPVSSDAGLSIGAALYMHHNLEKTEEPKLRDNNLYLGINFKYSPDMINNLVNLFPNVEVVENIHSDQIAQILRDKNIVAIFQGAAEAGPRALGNRSILFDPTFPDGKDFVNSVKHREYFRPFAGSILHEHVNEWFDMRGLEESPNMMYAVNCQPGVEEKIPNIIHVDGTCRIQTVKEFQNPLFYELISEFYKLSGVPILFNTSFNLGGEPLVESLHDAIATLVNSKIEYLYLPEYKILITSENQSKDI